MKRPHVKTSTRGFSLLEMMVVMAVSALLLGVATSMMFSLRQSDRRTREAAVDGEQRFRLAETLRGDIRAGTDVLLSVDGPLFVMMPTGVQIRYSLAPTGCTRSVGAPAGAGSANDMFSIGGAGHWRVERLAEGRRPLVSVTFEPTGDAEAPRPAPLIVYAALGADVAPTAAAD
jgi:prepilin-type N-terminal cleavage/methylation domain-containing protein